MVFLGWRKNLAGHKHAKTIKQHFDCFDLGPRIDRLAEGWLPSDDPVENFAWTNFEQLSSFSDIEDEMTRIKQLNFDTSELREVRHYPYFPSQISATKASDILRDRAYSARVRRSRAQDGWLTEVTAPTQLAEKQFNEAVTYLKTFAASAGAEYDGWEIVINELPV